MTDIRDELRDFLQRRAEDVPPHREVPRSLVSRASRRIALNAVVVGVAVVLVAGGALAGVRALGGPSGEEPGGTPTSSPVQPTPSHTAPVQPSPSASTAPACAASQLRAVGAMEGAAGSRGGVVSLTNFSGGTCTVQGRPAVTLLDQNLNPITSGIVFDSAPPGWAVNRSPEPAGWPVVTLGPGDTASVRVRWSNWCPDGRTAPLWRMEMPGGGTVDVMGLDAVSPPPCNGPGQPSTVEEGPFEPGPRS